jgi:hypothetical protein
MVTFTLFVDDLSLELVGTPKKVAHGLGVAGYMVCDLMHKALLEVSRSKSICTASSPAIGRDIAHRLCKWGIRF